MTPIKETNESVSYANALQQQSNIYITRDTLDYCVYTKFENQVTLHCVQLSISHFSHDYSTPTIKHIHHIISIILILSGVEYFFSFVLDNFNWVSKANPC